MTTPGSSAVAASMTPVAARLARNTSFLAISRFVARALGMGVTILLARHLGAEEYGLYQRSEAFVLLFSVVANLGLDMILTREVARAPGEISRHVSVVVVIKIVLSALAYAAILSVSEARGYETSFLWGLRLFGLVLLVNAFVQTLDAALQGLQAMRALALITVLGQITWTTGAVLVVFAAEGYKWVIAALLVAAVAHLVLSVGILARRHALAWIAPGWSTIRYYLKEAWPLAFAASFVVLYQQIDAVMLGDLKGNAEVGWYKAGAKILLIFSILRESFMLALFPILSSMVRDESPSRVGIFFGRIVRYQLVIAFFFVLILHNFAHLAPRIFGPEFRNTALVLPVLGWITIPQVVSITSGRTLIAAGHQRLLVVTTGISLLVNVVGNLVLIARYSFVGAAIASVISEAVVAGLNLYFVRRRVCPTPVAAGLAKPLVAALATLGVLFLLEDLRALLLMPLAGLVYAGTLAALRTFSTAEIAQMRAAAAGVRRRIGRTEPSRDREQTPLEREDFEE